MSLRPFTPFAPARPGATASIYTSLSDDFAAGQEWGEVSGNKTTGANPRTPTGGGKYYSLATYYDAEANTCGIYNGGTATDNLVLAARISPYEIEGKTIWCEANVTQFGSPNMPFGFNCTNLKSVRGGKQRGYVVGYHNNGNLQLYTYHDSLGSYPLLQSVSCPALAAPKLVRLELDLSTVTIRLYGNGVLQKTWNPTTTVEDLKSGLTDAPGGPFQYLYMYEASSGNQGKVTTFNTGVRET